MNKKSFTIPRKKIADFCKRWNIIEFSIFGSALRSDFRPDSDVDLVSKKGLETSRNYLRRKAILESARVIHAA